MAKTIRQALRGRGDFISDIYVRDMLYGATVRSPYPHALIRRLDASGLPEEIVCVTAADIPGANELRVGDESMPVLARGRCSYVGEPVAVVAGPTQRAVVEAAAALEIEYEEQHAEFGYLVPGVEQLAYVREGRRGDPDAELSSGAEVIEGNYRTGIQEHLYNEPQGAFAEIDDDGILVVRTATQWPYHVRSTVAENLAIEPASCIVRPADPGISLDGKLWYPSLVAAHAALLAARSGRPVKLVYSTGEDYRYTPKRSPFALHYQSGLSPEGSLHALRIEVLHNVGACPLFSDEISERVMAAALAHYRCPHVRIAVKAVRTHLPPLNVHSGFGGAAAFFATETHVNRVAEICGEDPVTWRLRNLADAAQSSRPATVTRAVAQASDFSRKFAALELLRKRREQFTDLRRPTGGIGFALGYQGSGFLGDHELRYRGSVTVRLEANGQASLRTSAIPGSRSVVRSWRTTIAEILGLDPEAVRIEPADTSLAPDSGPSTLSRNVAVIGRLIEQACSAIVRKRFRAPLPIEATRSDRPLRNERWSAATLSGEPYRRLAYGAAVAEVVVDPVTFEPTVQHVWISVDAGKIIDEEEARRALEIGVHQALEWTLHEVVAYRDGAIDPRSYLAYRSEATRLVPSIRVVMVPSPVKLPAGIGELPQSCVPAAVAAAISQATGRYMDRLPANPSLIHDYLETE